MARKPKQQSFLNHYKVVETDDIYTARRKHTVIFGLKHSKRLISRKKKYKLLHNRANLLHTAINYCHLEGSTINNTEQPRRHYWLLLNLDGAATVSIDGEEFHSSLNQAVLFAPWGHFELRATPSRAFIFEVSPHVIASKIPPNLQGRRGHYFFTPWVNLMRQSLQGASDVLDELSASEVSGKSLASMKRQIENSLLGCMRICLTGAMDDTDASMTVGSMSMAEVREYMEENLAHDLSVRELAKAAGASVRSLQVTFNNHFGMSPMKMLKQIRLNKARELLKEDTRHIKVADVCKVVGHGHPGRFSTEYTNRFGESPSETLSSQAG